MNGCPNCGRTQTYPEFATTQSCSHCRKNLSRCDNGWPNPCRVPVANCESEDCKLVDRLCRASKPIRVAKGLSHHHREPAHA